MPEPAHGRYKGINSIHKTKISGMIFYAIIAFFILIFYVMYNIL